MSTKAPPKRKPIHQQLEESREMLAARDQAQQTPSPVRAAFLGAGASQCSLELVEFSLGIIWLFEELKHPFNEGAEPLLDREGQPIPVLDDAGQPMMKDGQPLVKLKPLSMRDTARAILVWHDPEAAHEALAQGGPEQLDTVAMELACKISPAEVPAIRAEIQKRFTEGLATIPGAGGSNPPGTGS